MPIKPQVNSQQDSSVGLSRLGGAASRGSSPAVLQDTKGAGMAKMFSMLLTGDKGDPSMSTTKKLAPQPKPNRQFTTQAAGAGRVSKLVKSPAAFNSTRKNPDAKLGIPSGPKVGGNAFSKMETPASSPAGKARLFPAGGGSIRKLKG